MTSDRPGFALPAVLAVTGVVTLIFLVAITALASLTAEARSARTRVTFLERAMTLEARLALMAATEPLENRGFAVGAPRQFDFEGSVVGVPGGLTQMVRLDGRPYVAEVAGPLRTQLQDQAGLINIPRLDDEGFARMMAMAGARGGGNAVRARYLDYVDRDDLQRPGGQDGAAYPGGRAPNRQMRRPDEMLSVAGVRESVAPTRWRALRSDLAADPAQIVSNLNTMTPLALQVIHGLTPQQAQAAVRAREDLPFVSIEDLAAVTGTVMVSDYESLVASPSGKFYMTIADTRSPWVYRARVSLTPGALEQPFWIDQTELSEAPGRVVADISDADRLPYSPR